MLKEIGVGSHQLKKKTSVLGERFTVRVSRGERKTTVRRVRGKRYPLKRYSRHTTQYERLQKAVAGDDFKAADAAAIKMLRLGGEGQFHVEQWQIPTPDPKVTHSFSGEPVDIGETTQPDAENYPGWHITPLFVKDSQTKIGEIMNIAARTATPVESINTVSKHTVPIIEFQLEGSAQVIATTIADNVVLKPLHKTPSSTLYYNADTKIAHIAGDTGYTAIRVIQDRFISSLETVPYGDSQTPAKLWEIYDRLTAANH